MLKLISVQLIHIQVLYEENLLKNIDCVCKIHNFILLHYMEMIYF